MKLNKTKTLPKQRPRAGIVLSGFIVLFVAMALVTIVTLHNAKNNHNPKVAIVQITKTGFKPATLSVKAGTKIIWTNSDVALHQVASNPFPKDNGLPNLKSQILNNAQTYTYTTSSIGTFGYHDQLQPTINGTLVVQKQ